MIPEVFEQAQALTTLNGRPLTVLTASETLHTTGWAAAQDKLAALSTTACTVTSTRATRVSSWTSAAPPNRLTPSPTSSPPSDWASPGHALRPALVIVPRQPCPPPVHRGHRSAHPGYAPIPTRSVLMSHTTAHPVPHTEEEVSTEFLGLSRLSFI